MKRTLILISLNSVTANPSILTIWVRRGHSHPDPNSIFSLILTRICKQDAGTVGSGFHLGEQYSTVNGGLDLAETKPFNYAQIGHNTDTWDQFCASLFIPIWHKWPNL